jgi:hypothetical protein
VCRGCPGAGAGLVLEPGLLLGCRGEANLATVHADAPHLGRCWSRRENGRHRRRGRIAVSRQIWQNWTASFSFAARIAASLLGYPPVHASQ